MAGTNGEKLLNELNEFLNDDVKDNAASGEENDSALPFETIEEYIGVPNGFSDVTAKVLKKVTAVFDLAVKYNRHSSDYLKSCSQLEKGIKFLGTSCLIKFALEQKKHVFPELGQLNTANLYTMASIHFNKIDRALTEYMEQKQTVNDALLDMEFRYYHLMERIRATEVKLHTYRDKLIIGEPDYNPLIHGLAFTEKSWTRSIHEHDEPMPFQRARAFSASNSQLPAADMPAAGSQQSVVNDQLSDNDGVMSPDKDEEKSLLTPHSSLLTENTPDSSLLTDNIPLITEPPAYIDILINAMKRAAEAGEEEGTITFTNEEMRQLVKDQDFCDFEPEMAAQMRKIIAEIDSG
ncbi:MAG: hypothetical protein IJI14_06595 [Anaerolineaceae bacterium]|nr:hypothetical protein [Anaerolineaceae bacterium]